MLIYLLNVFMRVFFIKIKIFTVALLLADYDFDGKDDRILL
jgi:hypothetical protein